MLAATLGLDYKNKLLGVCTDGESAMMGRHQGCVTILQHACSRLKLTLQCTAHKTNRVLVTAHKHSEVLQRNDTVLSKVHALFNRRTGKYLLWQKWCGMYGITQIAFPTFNATRWFSRAQCALALAAKLPHLLAFLSFCNAPHNRARHWGDGVAAMEGLEGSASC